MRTAGILLPIFSLPSKYGIGTLGIEAYKFIDFLCEAGQTYWQILPINPTSFGDSPYQSFSSYAGNPYFIDFDLLKEDGYLEESEYSEIYFGEPYLVDYELLYQKRFAVLKKAYLKFKSKIPDDYNDFLLKNSWLQDYALFMALKNANGFKSWNNWPLPLKERKQEAMFEALQLYREDIEFYKVIQYFFYKQWYNLKKYANENGVKIIGDIPIYVAYDSADVWSEPQQFYLDENFAPIEVAGCPPDSFSKSGQLWGNPLYNWQEMKDDTPPYHWWSKRIEHSLNLYDIIRIDHFRGFESYYAIPFGHKDATKGIWRKGPGIEFFEFLKNKFVNLPIIAEDLGFLTNEVKEMLKQTGFPGMKVLQFGFGGDDSEYIPHNFSKNSVVYTGTHDNDTIIGWQKSLSEKELIFAKKYLRVSDNEGINWAMIKAAYASVSNTVIIPLQDFLGIGSEARINTPSTLGNNWRWRVDGECINSWLAEIIKDVTEVYKRLQVKDLNK